jgi:hypothetical protein
MRDTSAYVIDGVRWPSVSEVLSTNGLTDFDGIPHGVLEHARQRGREVHDWCDMLDKGYLSVDQEPDEEIAGYVAAYIRFKEEAGFEVIASEAVVINYDYRYVGTLDRLGYRRKFKDPNRPTVVDLKCVAMVSDATELQVSGYAHAATIDGLFATQFGGESLQLRKDGTYRLADCTGPQVSHDWFAFVRATHWKLNHGLAVLEN